MNFNDYITQCLSEGQTFEQIANQFAETLNKRQKETDSVEKHKSERRKIRAGLMKNISVALEADDISQKTAAAASTISALQQHPDWDQARIDKYYKDTLQTLELCVQIDDALAKVKDSDVTSDLEKLFKFLYGGYNS